MICVSKIINLKGYDGGDFKFKKKTYGGCVSEISLKKGYD